MSKKELNAWDRFWVTVRANEKVIWVILLVIISPLFAFPATSYLFKGQGFSDATAATIYGRKIGNLEFQRTQQGLAWLNDRQYGFGRYRGYHPNAYFTSEYGSTTEFLTHLAEADRLGIQVSDAELGQEVRNLFWWLKSIKEASQSVAADFSKAKNDMEMQMANYKLGELAGKRVKELKEQNVFGSAEEEEWRELLTTRGRKLNPQDFEETLRQVMRVEKLVEYVESTVQVTPDDALAEFEKSEEKRQLSFFEVRADADRDPKAKAELLAAITEAEIKEAYGKSQESLKEPIKIRAPYLSLAVAAFEKDVSLADDDLKKEYDRVKVEKYQTFLGGLADGDFQLLSPEEKAAREKKAYRPFEEVKEEIRLSLLRSKSMDGARAAANQIQDRLFPKPPGAIGDSKPAAPPAATFTDIVKEFPAVKSGETPWVDRREAKNVLGEELYSQSVATWFNLAEGSRGQPGRRELDAPRNYSENPDRAGTKFFVFYGKPQIRPAGVPPLKEVEEKVRQEILKGKLLEKAKEKAKAIADAIKDGKKTFETAAQEAGSPIVPSGVVERSGEIKVPRTAEEIAKAEAEAKEIGSSEPVSKEKTHPSSRVVIAYGFSIKEPKRIDYPAEKNGTAGFFAEDPENSLCCIVRLDESVPPDLAKFDDQKRKSYQERVLNLKRTSYLVDWRTKLRQRADVRTTRQRASSSAPSEGDEE